MVIVLEDGTVIGEHVEDAVSFLSRFRGMMMRDFSLNLDGMLFRKCNAVHTFFMKFPLDLVFLDSGGKVVSVRRNAAPWHPCFMECEAFSVLELPEGTVKLKNIEPGKKILGFEKEKQICSACCRTSAERLQYKNGKM